jgi:hypothetical protein
MLAFTSCDASQTRKSELGQRATAPHRSRRRYRVRMETTRAGPHERDLCQFGSIADLVRTKQKSPLHPGMAAENVADAGRSRPQQRSLRTRTGGLEPSRPLPSAFRTLECAQYSAATGTEFSSHEFLNAGATPVSPPPHPVGPVRRGPALP